MDDVAIERLRCFEADAIKKHPNGYWLGYSGGKDSEVVKDLAVRSGVKYKAHFSYSAEAPETLKFIRQHHPEVEIHMPDKSMWKLIETNGPPTRVHRWCCRELKERGGAGRVIATGVRRSESHARSQRPVFEASTRGPLRWMLHPIVDWPTEAVWEYIRERELPVNPLYSQGIKRVGCVMCPKANRFQHDIDRWPRIAEAYRKSIFRRWKTSNAAKARWLTPGEMWEWWISGKAAGPRFDDCGVFWFEDSPDM